MKFIGTTKAAARLGISPNRVRALIDSGRLKAHKIGREYAINPSDLKAVKNRKPGRPRKTRKLKR
jgi:excisionase family DNA binding protein